MPSQWQPQPSGTAFPEIKGLPLSLLSRSLLDWLWSQVWDSGGCGAGLGNVILVQAVLRFLVVFLIYVLDWLYTSRVGWPY